MFEFVLDYGDERYESHSGADGRNFTRFDQTNVAHARF
jgi:hypothetical protein